MTRMTRPVEKSDPERDDGRMPENVSEMADAVIGHKIVQVETFDAPENRWPYEPESYNLKLILDNGRSVWVRNTDDCCAYTQIDKVIRHLDTVDHVITAVETEEDFTRWFLVADLGDVLELQVSWSPGNPFYYAYGLGISVVDV